MKNIIQILMLLLFSNIGFTKTSKNYLDGRLIVKIKNDFSLNHLKDNIKSIGDAKNYSYKTIRGLHVFDFSKNLSIEDAKKIFIANEAVEYVEADYFISLSSIPNDPYYNNLWGFTEDRINAEAMWDIQTGSSNIVVGVTDTGIDYNHQDLVDNLWVNPNEIPNNQIDDDNNGYIDDIYGVNAILNNGDPMDDHFHGTHISGTIGAKGNNYIGVVGASQNVQIASCKFLSSDGNGLISDAIKCLDYFASLRISGINLVVTNNSWGEYDISQALIDAIMVHKDLDILFIASAGNDGINNDLFPFYPASLNLSNIISVTATDKLDNISSFSNYGISNVHVGAPGEDVYSTIPNNKYDYLSGTSMAAAYVTGLAAIIKAQFPLYTYKEIKNLIISSGTPLLSLNGKTISNRRVKGADINGTGVLTCENQLLYAPLQPLSGSYEIAIGDTFYLSVTSINCSSSSQAPITVYQDVNESIILTDSGLNGDEVANDGIFSLNWQPTHSGKYVLDLGNNNIVTVNVLRNYTANDILYSYENIVGTRIIPTDDGVYDITSSFNILFGGTTQGFKNLYVSTNGNISFDNSFDIGFGNTPLPVLNRQTLVAPYWDDLIISNVADSGIYYDTIGIAPNRKFVIEWRYIGNYFTPCAASTFQVVFYENSSNISFNYKNTNFGSNGYSFGNSATIGVQTSANQAFLYSHNSNSVGNEKSVLFTLLP